MTLHIKNYSFESRMCIVAKDNCVLQEYLQKNMNTMFVEENKVIFYPEEKSVTLSPDEYERLAKLDNGDILELHNNGLAYRSFANSEPDSTLFLGSKCNSNCVMCPAGDSERQKELPYGKEQILKYIEYLPDDLDILVVTGGEPTLNIELFLYSMQAVKEKFLYTPILLLTNGKTLSNTAFVRAFVEVLPNNITVAIPIHGNKAYLHDSITRDEGSFHKTILAIKKISFYKIPIELRIVVSNLNVDSLLDIAKLINNEIGHVKCVNFVGLEPRGNCAKNIDKVYIEHKDAFVKMKSAINYLVTEGYDVGIYNFPLCSVERGYWSLCHKSISQYKASYHEKCEECEVKKICGGFFVATIDFIKPNVDPILRKCKNNA